MEKEFAPLATVPDKAYLDLVASIVARLATTHHLVICGDGLELLFKQLPGMLRVHIVAPDSVRVGNVMLDERLERPAARQSIRAMEERQRAERKQRFGLSGLPAHLFDLILNAEQLDPEQIADLIVNAAHSSGLIERGFLSAAAEAQLQFRCRLRLSKHGIVPPDKVALPRKSFAHPSEEIFANLLDFYRIAWEYEPRSFPIQWDRDGKVSEAFTPDFLPAGIRSVCRTHHHEAVAGDQEKSQSEAAARTLPARQHPGVLSKGLREPDLQVRPGGANR